MSHPAALPSLSRREAIVDALYRAVLGLDTNDQSLFESAWAKDNATFERGDIIMQGMEAINKNLFEPISQMDTHHSISNVRVDVKDGADTAHMTTYTLARHFRSGEGMDPTKECLLGGSMCLIDLVKDSNEGLWKMKKWVLKLMFCEGDMSVMAV